MMTISYPLIETTDNSTGIALRRRASVVIDPGDGSDIDAVIVDAMKRLIRPGVECLDSEGRQHLSRFHADVAHLFVYADGASEDAGQLIARAVYVRRRLDKRAVPALPTGRVSTQRVKTDRGTLTVAIEREMV